MYYGFPRNFIPLEKVMMMELHLKEFFQFSSLNLQSGFLVEVPEIYD